MRRPYDNSTSFRIESERKTKGVPTVGTVTGTETNRRRQRLEIAFNLISSRGFEGLRFGEVAAQAGVNNATLYHYLLSKGALIQGVTEFLTEQLQTPP